MSWAISRYALAAAAAALLSSQVAYAAPAPVKSGIDPLVTLSILGTVQSSAAVCAGGASSTAAAAQAGAPGCVLPVNAPAPVAETAPPPMAEGPPPPPPPGGGIGPLPLILGLLVFVGLMAAILSGGGDAHGNLTPVSPA